MKKLKYLNIIFWSLVLLSCEKTGDASANLSTGKGGSLSKFTIIGNYVYAVSSHFLYTIDISNPTLPNKVNESR